MTEIEQANGTIQDRLRVLAKYLGVGTNAALIGLAANRIDDAERKLTEIREICCKIESMIRKDGQWRGSLEWVTGQIMCVAKYGPGYEDSLARERKAKS